MARKTLFKAIAKGEWLNSECRGDVWGLLSTGRMRERTENYQKKYGYLPRMGEKELNWMLRVEGGFC